MQRSTWRIRERQRTRMGPDESLPSSSARHNDWPERSAIEPLTHDGASTGEDGGPEVPNDATNMEQRHHVH